VKHKHNSKVQTDAVNRSIQAIDDLIQSCPDVPEYTPEIAEWILNSAMLTVESPGKSQSVCVSLNKPISRAVMAVTAAAAGIALWHVARANITLSVRQIANQALPRVNATSQVTGCLIAPSIAGDKSADRRKFTHSEDINFVHVALTQHHVEVVKYQLPPQATQCFVLIAQALPNSSASERMDESDEMMVCSSQSVALSDEVTSILLNSFTTPGSALSWAAEDNRVAETFRGPSGHQSSQILVGTCLSIGSADETDTPPHDIVFNFTFGLPQGAETTSMAAL
jgi:hypothetical protein